MVVNIPQEFEKGLHLLWGEIPFLVHFSPSSNYIVSKCLSHEGKATVTQLQIHKKSKNISLLAYSNSKYFFLNAE